MAINFIYKKRESLTGKSEAYKNTVRQYLELEGYSQIYDSFIDGTFEDMIFYNPTISPNRKFVVEIKAMTLSLRSKNFSKEIIKYFKIWRSLEKNRFKFILFTQSVKKTNKWELLFNENNNKSEILSWCEWFNEKCCDEKNQKIKESEIDELITFFSESEINVVNIIDLKIAIDEKRKISSTSLDKLSERLRNLTYRRKKPIMEKSNVILNILPIFLPDRIFIASTNKISNKKEIYREFENVEIPPFIWRKNGKIMTFSNFDPSNPLTNIITDHIEIISTKQLQKENPTLSSYLVHIHLRRILWKKGLWKDGDIFYFPFLNGEKINRTELNWNGKPFVVVTKYLHKKDTKFGNKGEVNFYFHKSVELATPTYWGKTFLEIIPRRYYTRDGKTPISGEERGKIDNIFCRQDYDRGPNRIRLMKFWINFLKIDLFEKGKETWFDEFKFGNLVKQTVDWIPDVVDRNQLTLWDYGV